MKVCWDNLNVLRYNNRTEKWYKDRYKNGEIVGMTPYLLNEDGCCMCGEPFFYGTGNKGICCSLNCNTKLKNSIYGISEETAKRIGDGNRGKKRTPEMIAKMKYRPQNQIWKIYNPVYNPILKERRRKTVVENGTYKGKNNPNWKFGLSDIEWSNWKDYEYKARTFTNRIISELELNIKRKDGQHIDHKFSIYEGFKYNVPLYIISHQCNLQIIDSHENLKKNIKCSITIDELYKSYLQLA